MLDGIERLVVETDRGDRIELGSMTVGQPATLDEALCISSWLERNVEKVRLVSTTGQLSSPLPALPDFTPIDAVGR